MCHRWMLRDSAMAIRATLRRSAAAPVAVAAGAALLSRHRGQSIVSAVSLSRAPRCTPIASGSRELSREAKPGSGGGRTSHKHNGQRGSLHDAPRIWRGGVVARRVL